MPKIIPAILILASFLSVLPGYAAQAPAPAAQTEIALPAPKLVGTVSVEQALSSRRSLRDYKPEALPLSEISQVLWAAQGISDPQTGKRTTPSPYEKYLLNVYLIAKNVDGLPQGLYQYQPQGHKLLKKVDGDAMETLLQAGGQPPLKKAAAALIIVGKTDPSLPKIWMYLEAGHAAENVYLEATALNVGTVSMGGIDPVKIKAAFGLPEKEQPIYVMPLGRK